MGRAAFLVVFFSLRQSAILSVADSGPIKTFELVEVANSQGSTAHEDVFERADEIALSRQICVG